MTPEPVEESLIESTHSTNPSFTPVVTNASSSLFETQAVAPAPGQTFYQALITKDKVILRDWPKLRYSQAISKVTLFPGEISVPLNEFAESNIKDTILNVFGKDIQEKMQEIVNKTLQEKAVS